MKRWLECLSALDRSEKTYWLGLALLFIGLSLGVSAAAALTVTGAVIAIESILTSYLASWIGTRK